MNMLGPQSLQHLKSSFDDSEGQAVSTEVEGTVHLLRLCAGPSREIQISCS